VATATGSAFQPRYTAVAVPLVVVVAAVGLASVADERRRTALLGVVVVLGLVGGWRNAGDERTQAGEVADAIEAELAPEDVVVFCPDQLGPGVTRLLPDGTATVVFPTGEDGSRVDWVDYEERNEGARPAPFARQVLERGDADGGTLWYVWSPNYRTYGTACEALEEAFQETGRTGTRLVRRDRGVPERAWLTRYEPR
jgi:mannosyltransferase